MIPKDKKAALIAEYAKDKGDTGSPDVQIALLSLRIKALSEHLAKHQKDHSSRRGLLHMISTRRSLLAYLKRENQKRYKKVAKEFNLA